MDHRAGKQDFLTAGIKALFESNSVFEREGESEFFYFKKGADTLKTRQAGFYIGPVVPNCVEVNLPFLVAFLSKIAYGRATHTLETLKQVRFNLTNTLESIADDLCKLDEEVMGFQMTFTVQEG